MSEENLIKNYAIALLNNAKKNNNEDEVFEQISVINTAINENINVKKTLCSPIIHKQIKIKIINVIIKTFQINKNIQNFLLLLIKNSRMFDLSEIITVFNKILLESKNIKMVQITSSKILEPEEAEWLKAFLEQKLKQKTEISFDVDPKIIGGILIKYDSILQDYSIKGSLNKIARKLKSAKVVV